MIMQPSQDVNIGKPNNISDKIAYQLGDEVLSDQAPGSNRSVKSNNSDIIITEPNPKLTNASHKAT